MNHIISVDPGSNSAWALWTRLYDSNYELTSYGRVKNYDALDIYKLLIHPTHFIHVDFEKCKVFVEGQWFRLPVIKGKNKIYPSANFARVAKIIESRCAWVDAAKISGAETEVIDPGKWIPAMTRGAQGKTPDARIKFCADIYYPERKKVADENAAILLGIYCIQKNNLKIKGDKNDTI